MHVVRGGQTNSNAPSTSSLAHVAAQRMILCSRPIRPAGQTAVAGTYRDSTLGQSFNVGEKGWIRVDGRYRSEAAKNCRLHLFMQIGLAVTDQHSALEAVRL